MYTPLTLLFIVAPNVCLVFTPIIINYKLVFMKVFFSSFLAFFICVVSYAALPPITGVLTVCDGSTTALSNPVVGGTWSSSDVSVAFIGSSTGITTGINPGTATIIYTDGVDFATAVVTVNPLPTTITGSPFLCAGVSTGLSSSPIGGSWSSASSVIATVATGTGTVTGVSTGITSISYTLPTGCSAIMAVTVSTIPGAISGSSLICAGATSTFTVAGGSGGTWSSSSSAVATVSAVGVVTGMSVGTAVITYNVGFCGFSTRVVTVNSACAGTPVPGGVSASASTVCSGTPLVLNLPSYTATCGHIIQWQYSPDGLAWTNLPGANTVPYVHYPTGAYYYRCGITCAGSGSTAYSGPVYVTVNFAIGSRSVISTPSTSCAAVHFYVAACGVSSAFSVVTLFGDGTSDTSAMSSTTLSEANVYHAYSLPGTYTVIHILRLSGTPVDTVSFSFNYLYCRTLPISLYVDNNTNCVFDAGDFLNTSTATVRVDSNGVPIDTLSVTSGLYYKALGGIGTVYAFRPLSIDGGLIPYCPSAGVLYDTITAFTNTYVTKRFGLICGAATTYDLSVNTSSVANGNRQRVTMQVTNTSCVSVVPVITLTHSPKYSFIPTTFPGFMTSLLPTTVAGNTLTWNLPAMAPNSNRFIDVWLSRTSIMGLPLIPGDTVTTHISLSPTSGDTNPANNNIVRNDTVRTSYDPNDIAVTPEGYILPCTKLTYTVRFENMGNDTARNVSVLDTLSLAVDPSTLQIVSASDPMIVSITNDGTNNIAKFNFPDINLLDSSRHGLNSGMFVFSVNARNPLTDGTPIMNRVGIYFDENPVVMTNSVTNTVGMAPITGPDNVCMGYPDTLYNQMQGGIWASSTTAVATVSSVGIVSPIIPGSSVISYTVSNSCTSRTATKTVTVNNVVTDGVSIAASSGDTACTGVPVTFTATPILGGATPYYIWQLNGTTTVTGSTYTYLPTAGDTVIVTLASSEVCAIPSVLHDTIALTVITSALPVASIVASPGDTSCAGSPVTFSVVPTAGGDLPGYNWFVNGASVSAGSSHVYVPTTGDVIYCRMGSNFICRLADTVNSSPITMTVDPLYVPIISISAAPALTFVSGTSVTFTATTTGAGPTPSYQWTVNDSVIVGATNSTYTASHLSDYDSVTCRVTGTGVCNVTTFNSVFVTVFPVGVDETSGPSRLSVFPNPNTGNFRIKGLAVKETVYVAIRNVLGQIVYSSSINRSSSNIDEELILPQSLSSGVYLIDIMQGGDRDVIRFRLDR